MAEDNMYERVAGELADVGTSALHLGPNADIVFTVTDDGPAKGEKLLRAELVTGEYHKATLTLTSCPILPPGKPWAGGVHHAVVQIWGALHEAIENFQLSQMALAPAVPDDAKGD
jgi:hypothetical protein